MNINTNRIYISWLRRRRFAFRLEHRFKGSGSVLETASSMLSKEWIGKSSVFLSCQRLWSGISETASVSRVRMLEQKRLEEAWSAEQGYFLPSENQTLQCCALEIKHSCAVLRQAGPPFGASWKARPLCPLALAILAHLHLSELKYKLFRASSWPFMCFERAVYN